MIRIAPCAVILGINFYWARSIFLESLSVLFLT